MWSEGVIYDNNTKVAEIIGNFFSNIVMDLNLVSNDNIIDENANETDPIIKAVNKCDKHIIEAQFYVSMFLLSTLKNKHKSPLTSCCLNLKCPTEFCFQVYIYLHTKIFLCLKGTLIQLIQQKFCLVTLSASWSFPAIHFNLLLTDHLSNSSSTIQSLGSCTA